MKLAVVYILAALAQSRRIAVASIPVVDNIAHSNILERAESHRSLGFPHIFDRALGKANTGSSSSESESESSTSSASRTSTSSASKSSSSSTSGSSQTTSGGTTSGDDSESGAGGAGGLKVQGSGSSGGKGSDLAAACPPVVYPNVTMMQNSDYSLWRGQLSLTEHSLGRASDEIGCAKDWYGVASAVHKCNPFYLSRKIFMAQDVDLEGGGHDVDEYAQQVATGGCNKPINVSHATWSVDGLDPDAFSRPVTWYLADFVVFPNTSRETVITSAIEDGWVPTTADDKRQRALEYPSWKIFFHQAILHNKQLACLWDAQRDTDTEKTYGEILEGTPAERQKLFYEMVTGRKAVSIEVSETTDDDKLAAELQLADSQPIVAHMRDFGLNRSVVVSTYDADTDKYLFGMRFPEDERYQDNPFTIEERGDPTSYEWIDDGPAYKQGRKLSRAALDLAQVKREVDFIVKAADNENAALPSW